MRTGFALACALLLSSCGATASPITSSRAAAAAQPPVAAIHAKRMVIHGDERVDNYYWLRNKDTPEVLDYLRRENRYAASMTAASRPLVQQLFGEMVGRVKETDSSVPVRDGNYYHYYRTEKGKQYPIYCRKRGDLSAAEEVVLDGNALAVGNSFVDIEAFEYTDDDRYLAYTLDNVGFHDYQLRVLDTRTGKLGPENRSPVTSAVWAADNQTLFYILADEAKRPYRLYRHLRGQPHDQDVLVYEEKDQRFELEVDRTRSGEFVMLEIDSQTTSETRFLRAARPAEAFKTLVPRRPNHQYRVDHGGAFFYILTNDRGRNFRLVKAKVTAPTSWRELLPHSDKVLIEALDVFRDFYVVTQRENGLPTIRISRGVDDFYTIAAASAAYELASDENPSFDSGVYRYQFQSPIEPLTIFEYHPEADPAIFRLKVTEVPGGYDPSDYEVRRLWAPAADGVKIPVTVIGKTGVRKPAPMFLIGYGAYGYPSEAEFNQSIISLLDRGVQVAIAHIRGGGELGTPWHDAGRMMHKKNTFGDFIAAAEFLERTGETARDRLAIFGRSAGGLLMGAVINMRPELFKAAVVEVPFVDVINTMLDESIPLTVTEYEEWGNPNELPAYQYMKSYCPYTNISRQRYPAMLVSTSYNDSQVMYWEPAKYVAKLRATRTDDNPLLFRINMAGGHSGSSGRYDALREEAETYAFVLSQILPSQRAGD